MCQSILGLAQGLGIAEETGDKELEKSAYDDLGNLHRCLGDVKKAIELIKQALIFFKETGKRMEEGEVCLNLGRAYYHRSDLTKAMAFSQQGLMHYRKRDWKQSFECIGIYEHWRHL